MTKTSINTGKFYKISVAETHAEAAQSIKRTQPFESERFKSVASEYEKFIF